MKKENWSLRITVVYKELLKTIQNINSFIFLEFVVDTIPSQFSSQKSLTILSATKEDEGLYTCTNVDSLNEEMFLKVVVQEPKMPRIYETNMNDNLHLNTGEPLELICKADGVPRSKITWTKV